MKTPYYFLFSLITLLLFSCKQVDATIESETDFSFNNLQPVNDSKINHFPRSIIGEYMNIDSTYLILTDKQIIYKWVRKNNTSFDEFNLIKDSSKIVGNRIYYLQDKFFEYRTLKDSIEITSTDYDTVFSISEGQIANRIRNQIVLNTKDSNYWKIKMVSFDKNKLAIKTLVTFEDLNRIDSLSKTKVQRIDSTRNIIELTRKEFKNMLKLKKFGYDQNFNKID